MFNWFTKKQPTKVDKESIEKAAYKAGLAMTNSQEFKFTARRISNMDELRNAFKRDQFRNFTRDDIVEIVRMVDKNDWEPLLVFAFKEDNKPFMQWLKYIVPVSLLGEYSTTMDSLHFFKETKNEKKDDALDDAIVKSNDSAKWVRY